MPVAFSEEELGRSNLHGTPTIVNGEKIEREPLSPTRMKAIFTQVEFEYPGSTAKCERALKEAVNGKCRAHRFNNKPHSHL